MLHGSRMWHSYASRRTLGLGSIILVTGGEEAVVLNVGDTLLVELPDARQQSVTVLISERNRLVIEDDASARIELVPVDDDASQLGDFKLSDGFSRQTWRVR